ncbi:hypothetical protein [Paenibacillus thiaminolyticus]|uniref:Uncharacterized protein n=1 Tax=Paenibacillus thiaminolyticus TaxID=49283 RepID=A0A3A3H4Q6_PANTH|nr:hypothetical protein [Paenibacillus thiaminolyticus]RJG26683.1 hypothetical protein DQX05_01230 [Paenibacillus thiaminolyticus]
MTKLTDSQRQLIDQNVHTILCLRGVMAKVLYESEKAGWEEVERLKEENEQLKRFKTYFDELYGQGLEISNWHQNGDIEPFDSFHDSAEAEMTVIQRIQEGNGNASM